MDSMALDIWWPTTRLAAAGRARLFVNILTPVTCMTMGAALPFYMINHVTGNVCQRPIPQLRPLR